MSDSQAETAQETPNAGQAPTHSNPSASSSATEPIKTSAPAEVKVESPQAESNNTTKTKEEVPSPSEEKKSPAVPEKLDLKIPEGSLLKPDVLEKIASIAKERGFSNEQAQALIDQRSEALSEFVQQQQTELKQKTHVEWVNEAKNDKEIGGEAFAKNAEMAKRVVERFGTDSFKQALNETGLGNHPELIRFVARIGKVMAEDQLVIPGTQTRGNNKSMEDLFYGESTGSN